MGPRIYNLFPTLAGEIAAWTGHLDRIAAMGFDWVYVNPFHLTGRSNSLYAVADYYRLNPALKGKDARPDDEVLAGFVTAASKRGISVMMDLVINHTASDAALVNEHPEWYLRDEAGNVVSPSAIDPDDPENVTVWGDLAEIDYAERPVRAAIVEHFSGIARHYAGIGFRGFRCDAAYKVPGPVWSDLIAAVRAVKPDAFFAAETLGCTLAQVAQLDGAGFDALFNSSKWWDFKSDWVFEQYERFRHIAPSIAFPESHDTPRVAGEAGDVSDKTLEAEYRFRYLFAAFFSTGVMLAMGYEYGFARAFDVARTRPEDWEKPRFDISPFIAEVNAMKARVPALNEEGAERLVRFADERVVALVRDGGAAAGDALALVNADASATVTVAKADIDALIAGIAHDVTPGRPRGAPPNGKLELAPRSLRVFTSEHSPAAKNGISPKGASSGARAVAIERVRPQLDEGRHAIKRIVGDHVVVRADVFRDGHDAIDALLLYREAGAPAWHEAPLHYLDNDEWEGRFEVTRNARYEYTIEAWPDAFATWRHDTERKLAAAQKIALELREGRALVDEAAARAAGESRDRLSALRAQLDAAADDEAGAELLLSEETAALVARAPDRSGATRYAPPLPVIVDRREAQFAAWYEMFPRSAGTVPGAHGTFADAAKRLPELRALGFDVVYLPPIHPIGHAFRKGKNNSLEVGPDDPGSPWAIGNEHGGHKSVEPALGTLADFDHFVAAAKANNLEVALDYALQCSPDHPYLRDHPDWFTSRPDGSIKYAENPPKKYQDIVNFNWFGPHAAALWSELRDVVEFWIGHGVKTFRVDNPHTKPFAFWKWMIADIQSRHPETIFLAEAFTRPKVMNELAKGGFTQSYTYFTWRNTKKDLTEFATELAQSEMAEFYRPHLFTNTPDILPPFLQMGGRPAFRIRLALAATLSSLYGIYSGYELCENAGLPGREEYLDSEKYEIRVRDWNAPGNIKDDIARINRIRRENPALQDWRNVRFYRADDDAVIFYGKREKNNLLLIAVNLDPFAARETTLWFPTGELGLADDENFGVEELLAGGAEEVWRGSPHGVRLDPEQNPAAIYRLTLPEPPAAV
jgi:starch synthase (maltosyl-transferring)